ncbi:TVP38/TMEM64 family protein [Metabacillus fastidiosus]|uniref:TVP38/TMEM64 family protein n=1 Tax=Metabacillus fastidiosus TaxID=1458 RepID=UPI002E1A5721|nr:TVP38/TMEM64 family protein [Metabacillus fastidiosus]
MLLEFFTEENLIRLFKEFRSFGPLFAIGLPMIEAFLPFLPLIVFIVVNVNSFGLWLGFLLTWFGSSLGSILVFFIIRRLGQQRFFHFLNRHKTVKKLMTWMEKKGFSPLFLLLCFPFTPSAAVNVVAGLSKISIWQYSLAVISGKFVMVFIVSFIGYDFHALITQPIRLFIAGLVIFLLWFVGKKVEKRLNISIIDQNDDSI